MILRGIWLQAILILCPYLSSAILFHNRVRKTSHTCTVRNIDVDSKGEKDIKLVDNLNIIFLSSSREVSYFGQQISNVMDYNFRSANFSHISSTNYDIEQELLYPSDAANLPAAHAIYIEPGGQKSSSAISALTSIVEKVSTSSYLISLASSNVHVPIT